MEKDSKEGILVAGGQGKGNKLTQLSNPRGVIVDSLGTIYVVDGWNHRVMRWCSGVTEGDVIVGGNGQGQLANQLNYPEGLAFDGVGNLYVADCLNHRIQRFDIQRN
jgi:sugar lactone lactonase YvrE